MTVTTLYLDGTMPELADLFMQALENGLWFFSPYQALWFTPHELAEQQRGGRFRWGPQNWRLRDPQEHIEALRVEAERARLNLERALAKL